MRHGTETLTFLEWWEKDITQQQSENQRFTCWIYFSVSVFHVVFFNLCGKQKCEHWSWFYPVIFAVSGYALQFDTVRF